MSQFTEYQVRRFRFLFNQYSEDAVTEADVVIGRKGMNKGIEYDDNVSWKLKLQYKLTIKEFHMLLPRFGPTVSQSQVKQFIYDYDTTGTGTLDFEDFLEFLADYELTLEEKRKKMLAIYHEKLQVASTPNDDSEGIPWDPSQSIGHEKAIVVVARHFINTYPDEITYLASVNLDDPECFFSKQDSVTQDIVTTGIVSDMTMLRRKIVVRICAARNLRYYTRIKKRDTTGVYYKSLDPLIRVECAGQTLETTAVKGSIRPEWNQDLTFDITIPPGEVSSVQSWMDRQVMVFSLMDFDDSGTVPTTVMLASAAIPLLKILSTAKKPHWQVLKMNSIDLLTEDKNQALVEVCISDNTQERWAWAKIFDANIPPEEVWIKKYGIKFKADTKLFFHHKKHRMPTFIKKGKDSDEDGALNLYTQYCDITKALRTPFRRRTFNTFLLDEHNFFCPLTSFVRPIVMHDERFQSARDAALAVSRIPFQMDVSIMTEVTKQTMSQLLEVCEEERLEAVDEMFGNDAVSGWILGAQPANYATENFFAQVSSPQTMIMRRKGSLLEHASLLCGLFLGMGFQSYVAIGKVKRRPYVWVVTISEKTTLNSVDMEFDDFVPCKLTFPTDGDPVEFTRSNFKWIREARNIQKENTKHRIVHWDPLTGMNFLSPKQSGFYFERIETLFNHQNIYFNVQRSDLCKRPFFCWDLHDLNYWIPFFSENLTPSMPLKCSYSTPTSIMYPIPFHGKDSKMEDRYVLQGIMETIQAYRRHVLFIPDTAFHRTASSTLQSQLARFEMAYSLMIEQRVTAIHNDKTSPNNQTTKSLSGLPLAAKNKMSLGNASMMFLADNSFSDLDKSLWKSVEERIVEVVPERHFFKGMVLMFKDANAEAIVEQIVSLGILDILIPGMSWVVAARVFMHEFGVAQVWVGIGYIADIAPPELSIL